MITWDCLGLFVFSSLVSLDFAQILRPRSDWKLRRLNQLNITTSSVSFSVFSMFSLCLIHGLRFLSESRVI